MSDTLPMVIVAGEALTEYCFVMSETLSMVIDKVKVYTEE